MPHLIENYDIAVVGAGHAGCEAALACARLGLETILFTVSIEGIALMPCNPNIGGSSKGHLVREVDALGGQMGINIDQTFIQSKMLNRSKGPAVHSLRAQADKAAYSMRMRQTLQETEHLYIRQDEVCGLLTEDCEKTRTDDTESGTADYSKSGKNHGIADCSNIRKKSGTADYSKSGKKRVCGVTTSSGAEYRTKAVVLCTGTYLNARCLYGNVVRNTGPNGLMAATHLTDSLRANGVEMKRFKTGTPARVDRRSLDFSRMQEQTGDERVVPFSFTTDPESVQIDQISCWLTYTNEETHEIIRNNLDRSPLFSGVIEGIGPRYCPSIEDKVVKFAEKNRHQLFLEPEGLHTTEMYISGMSSSLPEDVQVEMIHTVPGMEHAKIVRNAYAIEYDCIDPRQLTVSLEFKTIENLFSGGQFNGSSGYEEAAAQGLIAGINAARKVQKKEPLILDRSQCYIGVLIDDLVTKENTEPYRMMTSRAEYRLLLRQDNADLRLTRIGYEIGLIEENRYRHVVQKEQQIRDEIKRLGCVKVGAGKETSEILLSLDSEPLHTGTSLIELIRRPELSYEKLALLDPDRTPLDLEVIEQININIKYEGYISRQERQVKEFRRLENRRLPREIDYTQISGLRLEAQQKLNLYQPRSVGQAGRIAGVSPADISVLLVWLSAHPQEQDRKPKDPYEEREG